MSSIIGAAIGKIGGDIDRQFNIHDFRTTVLGDTVADRVQSALLEIARKPTNKVSWNALRVLTLADTIHTPPDSQLFYSHSDIRERIRTIEEYPQVYGANTLDRYWNEYVACHENPKLKWGLSSIISEVFSGEILHE